MAGIAALAFAYFLSQFYRSFLAVLTPVLEAELGATKADFSQASGAWFVAFALMQFAVGVSLDRFGPRRTSAVMLAIGGGGGALVFGLATSPAMLVVAMTLIGIGCAPVLMASLFIFAKTFKAANFAVATSWFVALGSLGNVFGATPLAAASESFGWRPVILVIAALTLLVAAALLVFVRDPQRSLDEPADGVGFGGFVELLRLRVLWPIIPLTAINYAPAVGIRGLWAGPYLTDVFGANALVIGNVTLFMAFAMVAGSFLYGPLDTVFKTRKWVAVVGNTISVAAIGALALLAQASLPVATILLVLIGVSGASYGLLMAHARAFVPPHLIGRGVTLMNFFSIGGVGVMQFATGAVVTGATVPGEPVAAYQSLFVFYAVALAVSVIVYLKARDARP
ncbi:MFS transporter [Aquibium carbonis]|uniref:MFS transporter n=1 Tax=Aquibium carbonis TaxID=2495581 RepID=A0A3S0G6H4_9HYPH|nr:MFS transporter [Aquibium carbonis]RST84844.1 MFS transporter [Aquibium carbonis]